MKETPCTGVNDHSLVSSPVRNIHSLWAKRLHGRVVAKSIEFWVKKKWACDLIWSLLCGLGQLSSQFQLPICKNQNHISTSLIGKMSFWHKGSAQELLVIYKRKNFYKKRSDANIDCTLAKYSSLATKSFVGKSLIPSFNGILHLDNIWDTWMQKGTNCVIVVKCIIYVVVAQDRFHKCLWNRWRGVGGRDLRLVMAWCLLPEAEAVSSPMPP